MAETRTVIRWALILTVLALMTIGTGIWLLYKTALAHETEHLRDIVTSQAALIRSVARFDRLHSPDYPAWDPAIATGGLAATLEQIQAAFTSFEGLGKTGELVLGRAANGQTEIFLRQRSGRVGDLVRIPEPSHRAEPMARALRGRSGTVVALDYAGTEVVAAYEPLPMAGWGLVAKKDVAEIREPYIFAAFTAGAIGLGLIGLTGFAFSRINDPLIQQLKRSEARYAQLIREADQAIVVVDAKERIEMANPLAGELFGLDPSAVIGRSLFETMPPTIQALAREKLPQREQGQSERYEFTYPHPTKGERILHVAASPLLGPDGAYEGNLALFSDVTEERRAQTTLERERRLLRAVLDTLPVGVWGIDQQGQFFLHNPAGDRLWGRIEWTRAEDGGPSRFPEFKGWYPETGAPIAPEDWAAARALAHGETTLNETFEMAAFDGTRRTLRHSAVPLKDDAGQLEGALVVAEDVTTEERIKANLRAEHQLLERVLETLPLGVWVVDATGQFIRHNPAGEAIWRGSRYEGGQAAYAEYKGWWADSGEEIAPEEWAVARAINRGETSLNEVIDIRCFDGSVKTIRNSAVPMLDEAGQITGAIIVNEDITDHRALERLLQRNENLLEMIFERVPVGMALTDEAGRFTFTNRMDTTIYGQNRIGQRPSELGIQAIWEETERPLHLGDWPAERALADKQPIVEEVLAVTLANGQRKTLSISANPILGPNDVPWGAVAMVRDITQSRAAEAERRKLADALQNTADAVFIMDTLGRIEYVNPAFEHITGFTLDEARGYRPEALLDAGHQPEGYYAAMWTTINDGGVFRDIIVNRAKDGRLFHWEKTLSPLMDSDGKLVSVVGTASDITEQRQLQDQIYHATRYDPLTDLPNRVSLLERLSLSLERSRRSDRVMALLLLDVSDFRVINDTFGHATGDEVLKELSHRLQQSVREGDLVARTSGDGFAVILEDVARPEDVPTVVEKLRNAVSAAFDLDGEAVHLNVDLGIALAPSDATQADALFECADTALAHLKRAGMSGYQFYAEDLAQRVHRRLTLEGKLRQGLDRDELSLHFQPQVDLATGRLRGLEVLLRWTQPELGPISPAEFIPIAEQAGIIGPLGEWVLDKALSYRARWTSDGLDPGTIAINLSPVQVQAPDMAASIERILQGAALSPGALELEITETALMSRVESGARFLEPLHDLGIKVAVDDFGTGYSSLAYLSGLPLDVLKIDRTFIRNLDADLDGLNASIVRSVISLAHSLGLGVVAEGVETAAQLAFLRETGCDTAQGYLLSYPTPADAVPDLLTRTNWLG